VRYERSAVIAAPSVVSNNKKVLAVVFRKMSKRKLLQGMNLCLRNARSLLREAEILAQAGAMSRAFVLAVLAQEEAGKVVLLTLMSHGDRSRPDEETLRALAAAFVSHDTKLTLLAEDAWKAVLVLRRRKAAPRIHTPVYRAERKAHKTLFDFFEGGEADLGKMKMRALYVDVSAGRDFLRPLTAPRRVLSATLQVTRSAIRDAGTLRDFFRRARTDDLAYEIITLIEKRHKQPWALNRVPVGQSALMLSAILAQHFQVLGRSQGFRMPRPTLTRR
jgi:AbiV family abortive infection protein